MKNETGLSRTLKAAKLGRAESVDKLRIDRINERLDRSDYPFRLALSLANNEAILESIRQEDVDFSVDLLDNKPGGLDARALGNFLHDERVRSGFPDQFISRGLGFLFLYSIKTRRSLILSEKLDIIWRSGSPPDARELKAPPPILLD